MEYLIAIGLVVLAGYFMGSIPFAVIICRRFGVDIFAEGSGNPGSTNVKRVLTEKFGPRGKMAGNLCFVLDALKGVFSAAWPLAVDHWSEFAIDLQVCGMLSAVLGHSFSPFLQFRGGKGVATTIGGMLAITPFVMFLGLVVWVVSFYATGYVSLASILLGFSLPLGALVFDQRPLVVILCLMIAGLIAIRHRSNIQRLRTGTEHRFGKRTNA